MKERPIPLALVPAREHVSGRPALAVMARRPVEGQVKTRLVPPLDAAEALGLYSAMLADRLAGAAQLPVKRVLALATEPGPSTPPLPAPELPPGCHLMDQRGSTLGERLAAVFSDLFASGSSPVVAIDSDSPSLPVDYVKMAFARLWEGADVVLGPAEDGGYYLVGLAAPGREGIVNRTMGTPTVLAETLHAANDMGLCVSLLPAWYDVDDASTLRRLERDLASPERASRAPTVTSWLAARSAQRGGES